MKPFLSFFFSLLSFALMAQSSNDPESITLRDGRKIACEVKFDCGDTLYIEIEDVLYKISRESIYQINGDSRKLTCFDSESGALKNLMYKGNRSFVLSTIAYSMTPVGLLGYFIHPVVGIALGAVQVVLVLTSYFTMYQAYIDGKFYYRLEDVEEFKY